MQHYIAAMKYFLHSLDLDFILSRFFLEKSTFLAMSSSPWLQNRSVGSQNGFFQDFQTKGTQCQCEKTAKILSWDLLELICNYAVICFHECIFKWVKCLLHTFWILQAQFWKKIESYWKLILTEDLRFTMCGKWAISQFWFIFWQIFCKIKVRNSVRVKNLQFINCKCRVFLP